MKRESFKRWLRDIKGYKTSTINTRIGNYKTIEDSYGNLDKLYEDDKLENVMEELDSGNHKIPIGGVHYTATATYKSTLKLYLEFRDNEVLDEIRSIEDISSDKHDGSYELVRETVESLSKVNEDDLDIDDLDMIYSIALGTWSMGIDTKVNRINNSNLSDEEKERLKLVLKKVEKNAIEHKYKNRENNAPSIGMFGSGLSTFHNNSNIEDAKKILLLLIEIKDLDNEDEILNILEEGFKEGINGVQTGAASIILHCLKPTIFPIINGMVIKYMVVLEGIGVVLNKAAQLTNYIENIRILKEFRNKKCKFKNYRALDIALKDTEKLKIKPNGEDENGDKVHQVDKAWFVGAVIDGEDRTASFIEDEKWINNSDHRYNNIIKSIEVGDRIAIKATSSRKTNLPFDINENSASTMRIKAIGTVKSNPKDGKTLTVDWEKDFSEKEWFFFTFVKNLWDVERTEEDWRYGALLDFTFHNETQDIQRFLNHPFWKEKYKFEPIDGLEKVNFNQDLNFDNLHFSDEKFLKSQISIALKSGKSIILIGPPGTGKSKLANQIVNSYEVDSKMVTAMSDWSSYDTIGGYKPDEDGRLYFEEGIFLSSFKTRDGQDKNQWLLIDEINRADIDKAFGPFFSALSGDDVELGLRDSEKRNIKILLEDNLRTDEDLEIGINEFETAENEYIIPKDWRIIATMNTFDKTSLYEMSYAFMRRFAFIPVAIPQDIDGELVKQFFDLWNLKLEDERHSEIATLWKVINKYRKIGPAIIEDIGYFIEHGGDYTSAIVIYILPQFEGLFEDEISKFIEELKTHEFIRDRKRLVESIEDFFNINLEGK